MSFLLDTNVVSEIWKRAPDPGVSTWFASVRADRLFLSVLVVGEIRQGIERLARRDRLKPRSSNTGSPGWSTAMATALSRSRSA